ncbi:MAG: AraC family transcriptional regulator [Cyanobacteria bacterium J06638_28]
MAQESVTFWREPILADLEVLKATYITHAFSRHTHEGYAMGVIESGIEAFAYRGSTYQAAAGTLVLIHPGEVHTGHAATQEGWQYRMIYPSTRLMQQATLELGLPTSHLPFFPEAVITDRLIVQQFRDFHRALEQQAISLERESRFLELAANLIQRHGEWRSPLPRLHRDRQVADQVKTYLHDNYADNVSLDDLSQRVNVPPLKLLRLCRQAWGLPPHRYLVQLRVHQAKRLIAAGMPLAAIAPEVGFADQSHLTRHFKRFVGVTPGQYRTGC